MIPIKDNIPTDRTPLVTLALILANAVVYLVAVAKGGSLISGPDAHELASYGAIPDAVTIKAVFASIFTQASIVQLLGNMLFLWIFGNTIEDWGGPLRFLALYVVGGLCALAVQVAIEPGSASPAVGAAGAIAALIGGYTLLYRGARVLSLVVIPFLFTVFELPAVVMIVAWFAMQAAFTLAGLTDGAAYAGQIVAFALGAVAIRPLASNRKPLPPTRVA